MAKKKKEEPVADNETGKIKVKAKKEQQPIGNETKGNITKVKAKMKKSPEDLSKETITKINLDQPSEEVKVKETPIESKEEAPVVEEVIEKPIETKEENTETPVVEEITGETVEEQVENLESQTTDAIVEARETGQPLPENVQKLVSFIEETGGDITDYVTLNQDYSKLDNHTLLKEYYKSTKPHLSEDEVDFVMEDTFAYDEDEDSEKDIKRKKLAMKEQVASARQHLESVKSKYYEDIKGGSKLTTEQQEAVNFFNRYNEKSEINKKQHDIFNKKTNQVFNDKFKGFEYNIGDKKFRFNVKDTGKVKETQGDINNFIKKFLNKDMRMEDAKGYHKSLYTAMNADAVANHFYEQGKADAVKDSVAKSKNIDMSPRQTFGDDLSANGIKVKVLNEDSSDFKFKIKRK